MHKNEQCKSAFVRNYILDSLEQGAFKTKVRLPGVKRIAEKLKVSHSVVNTVINTLVSEGIFNTVPRGGSYVQQDWRDRILHTNLTTFKMGRPWTTALKSMLNEYMPEVRLTEQFKESIFEIQTTATVQANHHEYMDLAGLFDECFPDKSDFDTTPFQSFYSENKLIGIPIIYSPRVIFYNPDVFTECDCRLPAANWQWDDFIDILANLRCKIEPERIMYLANRAHCWMNMIARSGGCLINPSMADPVRIDDDKTIYGIEQFRNLRSFVEMVDDPHVEDPYVLAFFAQKRVAFFMGGREYLPQFKQYGWNTWHAVPLPLIPGGIDTTMQATELLCIRKNCTNLGTARELIKLLLSQNFQNMLGELKYSIPIRKSSAAMSIDVTDPGERLFLVEANKVMRGYNLNSPLLFNLIKRGINMCISSELDVRPMCMELADCLRTYLQIENNSWTDKFHNLKTESLHA